MNVSPHRPNVLWLIAEDFGPALSCYGRRDVKTPHLDRFARQGRRYTHCYTTAPVCSPSRSAFMTGMYQTSIGAQDHRSHRDDGWRLPSGARLVTDRFRDAGYRVGNLRDLPFGFQGTGKTDWNFTPPEKPFDFDRWDALRSDPSPFFAQINFWETHRDFAGPPLTDPSTVEVPPYYPDHPVVRADMAAYCDSAIELDRKVGLVLDRLERDGLADNTIVFFMGDNGEAHVRAKQFCYEEGLHVPLIVRWPRRMPAPRGWRAGVADPRLVEAIDWPATALALCGIDLPESMQGRPFLGDASGEKRRFAFGARDRCDETVMHLRTVRDDRYRYIRSFTPETPFFAENAYKARQYPAWSLIQKLGREGKLTPAQAALCAPTTPVEQLFDLKNDPHQIHDLSGSDDFRHTKRLVALRDALDTWMRATGDPLLHAGKESAT